jgi:hypothetical protein
MVTCLRAVGCFSSTLLSLVVRLLAGAAIGLVLAPLVVGVAVDRLGDHLGDHPGDTVSGSCCDGLFGPGPAVGAPVNPTAGMPTVAQVRGYYEALGATLRDADLGEVNRRLDRAMQP